MGIHAISSNLSLFHVSLFALQQRYPIELSACSYHAQVLRRIARPDLRRSLWEHLHALSSYPLTQPNFELNRLELPDPAPHQVVVKQFASGICHSQLHQMHEAAQNTHYFGS